MFLSFFLSVLYLSDSKLAVSAPSARAWAFSSVAWPSRTRRVKFLTERAFRKRRAAPAILRSVAELNCSRFPAPTRSSRAALSPAGAWTKVNSSILPVNSPLLASLRSRPAAVWSISAIRPWMGSVSSNTHETRASVSSAANGWVSNVICMVRYRLRLLYMDCSTSLRASLVRSSWRRSQDFLPCARAISTLAMPLRK